MNVHTHWVGGLAAGAVVAPWVPPLSPAYGGERSRK
jgi:hypothetical protein